MERLVVRTHAGLDKILIEFGIGNVCPNSFGGLGKREAALIKYLVENPDAKSPHGSNLVFELAERVVLGISKRSSWQGTTIQEHDPEFVNTLKQGGYEIEGDKLRRSLPEELDVAPSRDEVRIGLETHKFVTTLGHLEQAIAAHGRGEWASANAQLRTYLESLLDDLASLLYAGEVAKCKTSHARQELPASFG